MALRGKLSFNSSISFLRQRFCGTYRLKSGSTEWYSADADLERLYQWQEPVGYNTGITVTNSYRCLGKKGSFQKVPLIVKDPKHVSWYSCGPTVYDCMHIGHASSYIRLDVLRRILGKVFNLNIHFVMGITDVDDKLISRASLLKKEFTSLASQYEEEFIKDMERMNILPPLMYIRVSDVIPQIINFIDKLLHAGHAYETSSGNVWFDLHNFSDSGRLSYPYKEWSVILSDKRNVKDFSLWKAAKPGEPYWEAPWGKGRPGWHIECSTICSLAFGNNVDIHTGAKDLCMPHHECEIYQCEAYFSCKQWVNYFFHTGHLVLAQDSQHKMSKSLGNVITVEEFLRKYSCDDLRMLCLQHHWRTNILYRNANIKYAQEKVRSICKFLTMCKEYITGNRDGMVRDVEVAEHLAKCSLEVRRCFSDDFDTPGVLRAVEELQQNISKMFNLNDNIETLYSCSSVREASCIVDVCKFITGLFEMLGFVSLKAAGTNYAAYNNSIHSATSNEILEDLKAFRISVRNVANSLKHEMQPYAKDLYKLCDNMRDNLQSRGIDIKDPKVG